MRARRSFARRRIVNGMFDFVAKDDAPDVLRLSFVLKLGGMDTDHHQLIGVLRLELFQIGNDMHAVDAAIGPEIEQDDFAFQRGERQRFVGI